MKKLLFFIGTALLTLISASEARAQMAQFKALYLYNFAKNIGWPENDGSKEFVITVVGDSEMAAELSKVASMKKIGSRNVVVRHASTTNEILASQVIYLGESKSGQISSLINSQSGNKVLIVAGKRGLCQYGAGIAFVPENGKLKYEISNNNIEKFGLVCSKKIIQLGTEVF